MKMCLNCGDNLLDAAKRCPPCGNKKNLTIVDKTDTATIEEIRASAPHPKSGLTPKWAQSYAVINAGNSKALQQQAVAKRKDEAESKGIVCCPKCGFTSVSADKKGFGIGKAVVGRYLGGPLGLMAGNLGAKKVRITCLKCGNQWWAGKA